MGKRIYTSNQTRKLKVLHLQKSILMKSNTKLKFK